MKIFIIKIKRLINIIRVNLSSLIYSKGDFSSCGDSVFIHDGVKVYNPELLTISDSVYIGPSTKIFAAGRIEIEYGVVIGEGVQVMSSNHEYDVPQKKILPFNNNNSYKKTVLSRFCWIGNNSIILPGVTVGKYCVVAAGSVITKSTQDYSVYGGNPARLLKYRENKELEKINRTWVCEKNKNSIYFIQ